MRSAASLQPDTRDRILAEAEKLFRSQGYAKTTVADIAKVCGMSPANVYRFFESKAALNEAITGVVLRRFETLALAIARERRPAAERLRRLIVEIHQLTLQQCLQESRVHKMVAVAMDQQWAVIDAHNQRMRVVLSGLVEEGVRNGEFGGDAQMLSECVFNATAPFCHPQLVAERFAHDRGQQAIAMGEFLVRALKSDLPN